MVAVIAGQSARLNVVNRTGSPGNLPPDVCDVQLVFLDRTGAVRLQTKITAVDSGQAVFVDLSASKLTYELGKRHELRAFVRVTTRQGSQLPPDVCKPSVEIYDEATGETKVFRAPPDPDMPAQ
jgi:hypothetical protein